MQSLQQQQIEASQSGSPSDYLHEMQQVTPRRYSQQQHEISQSYPLRQSPSQLSQMSAITTPSCFPQEFNVAPTSAQSNTIGHLQQPMLVGGPIQEIYETASTGSSPHPGVGIGGGNAQGVGSGEIGAGQNLNSSAFSSGRDLENRRLREELSAMNKRMEEKDAIISQLMKRIGDLESMNRSTVMQAQQHHHPVNPKPSFTMDPASNALVTVPSSTSISLRSNMGGGNGGGSVSRHTPVTNSTSDSYAMTSLWDQSQPAFRATTATVAAFQQQRSQSHDTESLSVPSSLPVISGMPAPSPARSSRASSLQQQLRIRSSAAGGKSSMKMSPNTIATNSTASVTTANSSKSNTGSKSSSVSKSSSMGGKNRRKMPSSRSISGDTMSRKSPHRHRRGGSVSGSQKSNDDRKFVC